MRFCKLKLLSHATAHGIVCGAFLLLVLGMAGCQNRPFGSRLFNFGRTERVPPPPTNSLNIPQFSPVLGTSPATSWGVSPANPMGVPSPGSFNPTGAPLPNPGVANPSFGSPTVPGIGVSPWNSSAVGPTGFGNPGPTTPALSQIPDRGFVPGSAFASNGVNATTPVIGVDPASVPALLPGGFDPYDTSRIPTWSAGGGAGFGSAPMASNSWPTTPPGAQEGFWPGQLQTPGSPGNSGFGSGQWLRRVFGGDRWQPANVTGYATTAPIDNPMIPVTSSIGSVPQTMAGSYPVQPAAYVGQPVAAPGNGLSYARWREMQVMAQAQARQQAAWQQAQMVNQQLAQTAALRSGPGAGGYQVLAESSTSRTAENQSRFGLSAPPRTPSNPNYAVPPAAGASGQAIPGQAPPMFRSAGQPLSSTDNRGLQTGWQSSGVR